MKHEKPTKFDENWCGFEKLRRIINENTVKNTKRKNEQEHCLILFVENNEMRPFTHKNDDYIERKNAQYNSYIERNEKMDKKIKEKNILL